MSDTRAVATRGGDAQVAAYDPKFASTWTPEQKELIKRQCAQGSTDDEFAMFLHFCKESGVDPLRKQAHFVVNEYYSKKHQKMVRSTQMIVGIDGFRKRAEEMPDFRGLRSSAVYAGEDIELDYGKGEVSYKVNPLKRKPKAVVGAFAVVHRQNRIPYIQWIDWAEYRDERSPMHQNKPAVMCCKTAEATALRHEYPEKFSGMYVPEEMPSQYHVDSLMGDGEDGITGTAVEAEAEVVQDDEPEQPTQPEPQPTPDPVEQAKEVFDGEEVPPPEETQAERFERDFEGPPPEERNIPQEIRLAYGKIVNGIQTCLDRKFTKQQASDLLGAIMNSLDIPAMDYTEADGMIHTKPMSQSREGIGHANRLLNALKGPNALDGFKKLALQTVFADPNDIDFEAVEKRHKAEREAAKEAEQGDLLNSQTPNTKPEPAGKNGGDSPEELLTKHRKAIVEIQATIGKEYGAPGVKLGVQILQACGLGAGSEMTVEKCEKANAELIAAYTKLCSGTDVNDLLK